MSADSPSPFPDDFWQEAAKDDPGFREGIVRLWTLLEQAAPAEHVVPDDHAAWSDLQRRINSPAHNGHRLPTDRPAAAGRAAARPRPLGRMVVATGLVVLVGAAFVLWHRPVVVYTPAGDVASVTLPDGSVVELNSGTTLRYPRGFAAWPFVSSSERTVSLDGEAFFDVVRGDRPFVVYTANAETRVYGTTFNVWARTEGREYETRVTLASGQVGVRALGEGESVVLREAGDMARIGAGEAEPQGIARETASLDHVLSWRQRGFVFIAQPLRAIVGELERRFGIVVTVQDVALLEQRLTVLIGRDAVPESILSDVCLALECRFRPTSQGFSIYEAGETPAR
jgi:ferric-dicitrate binding protein FerR (iron transport regulator)